MDTNSKVWGWHYSLDISGCNYDKITSASNISNFAKVLVKRIDMVAYGEPWVVNFGDGDREGFTLVQLIETSNICAHFSNDLCSVFFDCFSCKPFNNEIVKQTVVEFFGATSIKEHFFTRQA